MPPDLSPVGAPTILPGYGPNTRTVMQIKVSGTRPPGTAFNLQQLQNAFSTKADGTGVFESGQHPIIVGQAAYNSAYGNELRRQRQLQQPSAIRQIPSTWATLRLACDGLARINDQGGTWFGFNTLRHGATASKLRSMIEPKGIHDEMNSATFDEFGRMTREHGPRGRSRPRRRLQNIILYPYVNPPTELIDGTKLPNNQT